MTSTVSETLPRWDLESLFPGPDSPEFRQTMSRAASEIPDLEAFFDDHNIGADADGEPQAEFFADLMARYNTVLDLALRLEGYLYCLVAADVRDEAATAAAGEWRQSQVGLARLAPRFADWVGSLDLDSLVENSQVARDHASTLRRIAAASAHLMPPGEESLAAALAPTGIGAWVKLRDDLAGRATARIEIDGDIQELPLSEAANLGYHEDRGVRQQAYEAVRATWESLELPLAMALNGVKGQQLALSTRRGWADPLDQALFANAIDRDILDALQTATVEFLPDYQRYLRAKARALGLSVLASYDLNAPVGQVPTWPYERSRQFITEVFHATHPALGALAERAYAESWIDAEPREGKDGGGFCAAVGGTASRIFVNYLPVYDSMCTMAHELGHAYHTLVAAEQGRTPLQAPPDDVPSPLIFPMTLAETASTFCEVLAQRAARAEASPVEEIAIIEGWLNNFASTVFGIHARFLLEQKVFALRRERDITAAELKEIMAESWTFVQGDAIDPDTISQYDWTKPHYYIEDLWYYNFPYAFGSLFAMGLLAVHDARPAGFFPRFERLLADSGMEGAAELAAPFGIDLRSIEFWRSGLQGFRDDVDRFEALVRG